MERRKRRGNGRVTTKERVGRETHKKEGIEGEQMKRGGGRETTEEKGGRGRRRKKRDWKGEKGGG